MYFRRSQWLVVILFVITVPFSSAAQRTSRTAQKPSQTKTTAPTQPATAPAPKVVAADWETLRPEKEDFTILMPKDTTTQIAPFEYHKFQLNTRLYMSAPAAGPIVGVASIAGIKSTPGSNSDFERFNSYADAFKQFFPPKVRNDAVPKMILTATRPFHGYTARVYKLTIGDLTGTVNAVVTRKRFYAIALLSTTKDDALEEKFISSFVIPDKPVDQPNVASTEEPQVQEEIASSTGQSQKPQRVDDRRVSPEGGANNAKNVQGSLNTDENNTEAGSGTAQANQQPNQTQQQGNQKRPPISGGMLNGKAIYMPLPEIPPGEKAGGVVMVQILVDEQGTVIDARAVSGPPGLHASAVNAARFARFSPTMLMGEPVRVQGTLAYNFAKAN